LGYVVALIEVILIVSYSEFWILPVVVLATCVELIRRYIVIRSKKSSKVEFRLSAKEGTGMALNRNESAGRNHNAGVRNVESLSRVAVGGCPGICWHYFR
jgi:hypothetical protein